MRDGESGQINQAKQVSDALRMAVGRRLITLPPSYCVGFIHSEQFTEGAFFILDHFLRPAVNHSPGVRHVSVSTGNCDWW